MSSDLGAAVYTRQTRNAPRRYFFAYAIVLCVLYIFVRVHTPMTIYASAPHDDTLFMRLGEFLVQGQWLGPFDEFTLVKGPGFPLFLAISQLAGLPVSVSIALFHCTAVLFFSVVSYRFLKSYFLSAGLLSLLLWHPSTLTLHLLRVYRDDIYYAQVLIALAAFLAALFAESRKNRILCSLLAGLSFGWVWLSREEGVWLLPGTAVLLSAVLLHKFRARRLPEFAIVLALVGGSFVLVHVAYRATNFWYYDSFAGVDFKEKNYQRALAALHSVRSGGTGKTISITRAARERVYAVSPAFASLKYYLDGPSGDGWAAISCGALKFSCGEIGSGFFIFAVRHAAAGLGHYSTPAASSLFFGRVADEIEAACGDKRLECVRQPIAEMSPVVWKEVLDQIPPFSLVAVNTLLFMNPPIQINGSGSEESLKPWLRFLNYPMNTGGGEGSSVSFMLSGWYYRNDRDWVFMNVFDAQGVAVSSRLERKGSPDLAGALKNPNAELQRFYFYTTCRDDCVIRFETPQGAKAERRLADFRKGSLGFDIGDGHVHVDSTAAQEQPVYASDLVAQEVRSTDLMYYQYVFLPVLAFAAVAFLMTTIIRWRVAIWNLCYVLTLVSIGFVAARMGLLVFMGAATNTSLHINPYYGAPAYFHLICAAVFAIGAAWQLLRSSSQPQ